MSDISYRLPWKPFGDDLSEERIDRVVIFEKETGERRDLVYVDDLIPDSLEEILENQDPRSTEEGESR